MGPLFVLLFWGIIAAICGGIWIAAIVFFFISRKKQWKLAKWFSGSVVVTMPLLGFILVSVKAFGIVRASIPQYVFKDTFHRPPGESVRNINSKVWRFADEGNVYIRFETDIGTFRKLVPEGLPKVTKEEYEKKGWSESSDPPSWWKPSFAPSDEIYLTATDFGNGKTFASEMTIYTYDTKSQVAYYHFLGID
jgi:hypothetical protein